MASEGNHIELLQGTLDLIVLRALSTMGPLHAYALATRLAQVSDHPLSLNQGTLYPALVRREQKGLIKGSWGKTESDREAKHYHITQSGKRQLTRQAERWRRLAGLWINFRLCMVQIRAGWKASEASDWRPSPRLVVAASRRSGVQSVRHIGNPIEQNSSESEQYLVNQPYVSRFYA